MNDILIALNAKDLLIALIFAVVVYAGFTWFRNL